MVMSNNCELGLTNEKLLVLASPITGLWIIIFKLPYSIVNDYL